MNTWVPPEKPEEAHTHLNPTCYYIVDMNINREMISKMYFLLTLPFIFNTIVMNDCMKTKEWNLCWWFAKRLFRWHEWHGRTSIHCYWSEWLKFNQWSCTSTRSNYGSWFRCSSIWQYSWNGKQNWTQFDSIQRQRHSLQWNSEWKHKYKTLFTERNIVLMRKS